MAIDIPQPWGAITRSGTTCTLLPNKTFDFSTGPFASQYTINGRNILASPITLQVEVSSGSAGLQSITATPTIDSEEAGRVVYEWSWTGVNNVAAFGTITVDYDGCTLCEFTIRRTSSQQIKKLKVVIPLVSGLVEHLLAYPRSASSKDNWIARETVEKEWAWDTDTWTRTWVNSNNFPRQVLVHDTEFGFEWAMECDRFFGMPGYTGSTATIEVDTSADTITINMVNAAFPQSGTVDMTYGFYMTPLPTRAPSLTANVPRLGDTFETPASSMLRPLADECGGTGASGASHWKYFGSLIRREGSWNINSLEAGSTKTYDERRALRTARGLSQAGYASVAWWPDEDPDYLSAWDNPQYSNNPANPPFYKNCDGSDRYYLNRIDPRATGFADFFIERVTEAFDDDIIDGVYLDGHNHTYVDLVNDTTGQNRYLYPIGVSREIMRRLAVLCQSRGKTITIHGQCDFVFASGDHMADFMVPGEQWATPISALSGNERRRFYFDTITQDQWKGQHPSRLFGIGMALLPEWRSPESSEAFPTETSAAMAALHNVGNWHGFTLYTVLSDYFTALKNFGMEEGATFYGYWYSDVPATTADEDAKVSCWVKGLTMLVAVVNFTDTDRAIDFTVNGVTYGETVYAGGSASTEESRSAYSDAGDLTGSGGSFTVNVARKNMALVQFARAGSLPSPQFGRADSQATTGFGRPKIADDVFARS